MAAETVHGILDEHTDAGQGHLITSKGQGPQVK